MQRESGLRRHLAAANVAVIYAVFGVLWILWSDRLLLALVDGDMARLARLQTWKGWFYVAVTAALLYVLVRRAITGQVHFEKALRRQAELLQLFYKLPFIGMALTSPQTRRWVVANPCLCEMLGYPADELTKKTWAEVTHPEDLPADAAQFERLMHGEIDSYQLDKRFIRKDGEVIYTTINIRCVRDESGGVKDVLATVHDITRHKQAEDDWQALNMELERRVDERTAQLESVNRELESFSYSVSHDLKAPLRGIDGYSQLLMADYHECLDDEGGQFLVNIRRGVAQMHQLIEDMLAYSRMERSVLETRPVDLQALVQSVVGSQCGDASETAANIVQSVPALQIRADPDGLMLVLRNLLENALKFSTASVGQKIEMGARSEGNAIVLWVRDNGVGFDMRYHDRIFEIFQRLHRAEDYPGTGVGLALVKKAVQRMGGRVWAESTLGHGATFFVELPK